MKRLIPIVVLAACGTEGGEDGGGARLPNRGIAGWERVASESAPFVLPSIEGETWDAPHALVVDGEVIVWLTASDAEGSQIRASRSSDGVSYSTPVGVFGGSDASVAAYPSGLLMAYTTDQGLAIADGVDPVAFAPIAATNLPDVTEPSIVVDGDRVVLYGVSPDGAIVRAEAPLDTLAFGEATVALAPIVDCTDAFGETEPCWDGVALGAPDVRLARTALGRPVWRMWFTGRTGPRTDLGFAASDDGVTWTRYAFNPIVAETLAELGPSSVVFGDDYLLFWSETLATAESGIALARIRPSPTRAAPSDRW